MKTPVAPKIPYTIERHGTTRVDEYHWLKDQQWQAVCEKGKAYFENAQVLEYIEAENAYTQSVMADTEHVQQKLYEELLSRVLEDDSTVAIKDGPFFYYSRTVKGQEYPLLCRKKADNRQALTLAQEEVWMDVNLNASLSGSEQYQLGCYEVSPNHEYAAYTFNTTGSMHYTITIRQMVSGNELDWVIENTTGSLVWANNSRHLVYVSRHPENGRGYEVKYLDISCGTIGLLYTKPDQHSAMFMHVAKTSDEQWLLIHVGDHVSNEVLLIDASAVASYAKDSTNHRVPKLISPLEEGVLYDVEHFNQTLYIHTNKDAENFQIMRAAFDQSESNFWQPVIAAHPEVYIESLSVYQSLVQAHSDQAQSACYLIYQFTDTEKALPGIKICDLASEKDYLIEMPDEAYSLHFIGSEMFQTDKVIYYYESPVQPYQSIELDLETRTTEVVKIRPTPNYDSSLYTTERRFAKGHDGVDIPVTIVYRKTTPQDGSAPCFVYGYGSYGSGMPAYFSSNRMSLLDRGFVFAIAHVRGGDDKGYAWYLDGKLDKKKNTFYDFISVCEFLIEERYTRKGHLVANGGSAGGLLMGAIANMRPDLFRTIIADVPFVDLMNTMEDDSLPLTESEWNEWGNPLTDEKAYHYMLSYSPYDNVTAQDYPHLLFNSGISDEQVTYWEPTKMVARLREKKTDDRLLLLKVKMSSGHSGASKRYESYRELAFDYAFCLKTFEMNQ